MEEIPLADPASFHPVEDGLRSSNPIDFPGYDEILKAAAASAGHDESLSYGEATIEGQPVELALFNFRFMAGSMGEVAGERLARSLERAAHRSVPLVLRTETGGARMQEGMAALVQMPKLVAARAVLTAAHVPLICVLGDPTTGGVLASIGALADLTVGEAGATMGFAGPRVAERATGRRLSPDSHSAAAAYEAGLIDAAVAREDAGNFVGRALKLLQNDDPRPAATTSVQPKAPGDAWSMVEGARSPERPTAPQLARAATDDHIVLRGDRAGGVDPALFAALARILGRRCVLLALDRAHSPGPSAYRTARRAVHIAARLDLPVVTLIDTRGADPSAASESAGIAWEISGTADALLSAAVPVVAVVTGEGGSGGALALALADELLCAAGSIFSVIAPELAAEILWRDSGRAPEAARLLKLTAPDLLQLGIADRLISEPLSGESLAGAIADAIDRNRHADPDKRRQRWRTLRAG